MDEPESKIQVPIGVPRLQKSNQKWENPNLDPPTPHTHAQL